MHYKHENAMWNRLWNVNKTLQASKVVFTQSRKYLMIAAIASDGNLKRWEINWNHCTRQFNTHVWISFKGSNTHTKCVSCNFAARYNLNRKFPIFFNCHPQQHRQIFAVLSPVEMALKPCAYLGSLVLWL